MPSLTGFQSGIDPLHHSRGNGGEGFVRRQLDAVGRAQDLDDVDPTFAHHLGFDVELRLLRCGLPAQDSEDEQSQLIPFHPVCGDGVEVTCHCGTSRGRDRIPHQRV